MKKIIFLLCILLIGCSGDHTYFKQNYIQAHHTDIDYSFDDSKMSVNNVYCRKMWGSSMNPSFFEGNVVCLNEYTNQNLKQGNIIHYTTDVERIHRIVSIQPNFIVVEGDNSLGQDIINYSQVKGILAMVLYD